MRSFYVGAILLASVSAQAIVLQVPSAEYPTISSALGAAAAGDTVELLQSGSPFTETGMTIPGGVHVRGEGVGWSVVIDGQDTDLLFMIIDAEGVEISNLTIQNGNSSDGGAVYLDNSTVTISEVYATGNHASNMGGFAYLTSSSLTIDGGCLYSQNTSGHYGGAIAGHNSKLYAYGGTFTQNSTETDSWEAGGGAVWLHTTDGEIHSEGEFYGVTFDGNDSYFSGGAVGAILSDLTFTQNCQFANNRVETVATGFGLDGRGAAIYCNNDYPLNEPDWYYPGAFVRIEDNCTFSSNKFIGFGGNGGAVWTFEAALSMSDCAFNSNGYDENYNANFGGAILFGGYDGGAARYDLSIVGAIFKDNKANNGGAITLYNMMSGGIFNAPLIRDSQFIENEAGYGGAVYSLYADSDFQNCLFSSNSATGRGGALYHLDFRSATMTHCTVVNNSAPLGSAIGGEMEYASDNDVVIMNCILANNMDGEPAYCTGGAGFAITYSNIHGHGEDGLENWIGCLAGQGPDVDGNMEALPGFVTPDGFPYELDFRLRWNSPCLDKGTDVNAMGHTQDWDRTAPDIGYFVDYGEGEELEEAWQLMEPGWYTASSSQTLFASDIAPGCIVRVDDDVSLVLHGSDGAEINVGGDGPRTAFVGPISTESSADLSFEGAPNSQNPPAFTFEGVLFNHPARTDGTGLLSFHDADVTLETASFQNYLDARVYAERCTGSIANLTVGPAEVGDVDSPARLEFINSNFDISHCAFAALENGTPWRLKMVGTGPDGTTGTLSHCDFDGNSTHGNPVELASAVLRITHTDFFGCRQNAIHQDHTTTYMDWGALNMISSMPNHDGPYLPLFDLYGGALEMFCGKNVLLHPYSRLEEIPFVSYSDGRLQSDPYTVGRMWSYNQFGTDCSDSFTEEEINGSGLIPGWAYTRDNQSGCGIPFASCEELTGGSAAALQLGIEADQAGYYGTANAHYNDVNLLYPKSKEVTEASNRLKALGQNKYYGPGSYASVSQDLFDAGNLSASLGYHAQEVMQFCNGWLVEGYYGDRQSAEEALWLMYNTESDPKCANVIMTAIKELGSYPIQNSGLYAMNPAMQMEHRMQQTRADLALLDADWEVQTAGDQGQTRPVEFTLAPAYPNPFNPVTHLDLVLPEAGLVEAHAYNVLGQRVQTLISGHVEAGSRQMMLDGSRLATGLYVVQVEWKNQLKQQKVLLVK
jgi:predicted outer membrane repeat protein